MPIAHRKERALDPLELELQSVVNTMWVLGNEAESSEEGAGALTSRVTSPATYSTVALCSGCIL